MAMSSQSNILSLAASMLVAIILCLPRPTYAFQTFHTISKTYLSKIHHPNHNHNHLHHPSSSATATFTTSKETSELIDLQNNDDDDNGDNDSWVLRQITFLDLTAAPSSPSTKNDDSGDDDEDDTTNNNIALDARNLSEFLMEIGACSVSITDSDLNTDNEDPIFDEPSLSTCQQELGDDDDKDDDNMNEQWAMIIPDYAAGRNLWKRCNVCAHFPNSIDIPDIIDAVRYTFHCPTTPRYKVDNIPDRDWVQHVQSSWDPIVTSDSKFVLRFPWHDNEKVMKACQVMEMNKMQEMMSKQFDTGVKREGAVVHFDGEYHDDEVKSNMEKNREYVQIELEGVSIVQPLRVSSRA